MKRITYSLLLLWTALFSCKKGTLVTADHKFGAVNVELANLPGTPTMDVFFNGKLLPDSLVAGQSIGITSKILLEAETKGRLVFKKHGKDSLLVDTLVSIPQEQGLSFKLAFSQTLGIKGFLTPGAGPGKDSVRVQLFNNAGDLIADGTQLEAHLYQTQDPAAIDLKEIAIFPKFNKQTLAATTVTIPQRDAAGTYYLYYLKLKDMSTGQFFQDGRLNEKWLLLGTSDPSVESTYMIYSLNQSLFIGKKRFQVQGTVL